MATEAYTNNASTTLNGAINNAVTSVVVSAATGFPSSGQYRILVDSEYMLVTAGQGTTTWTVTRGAEGSTAATHGNLAAVTHILTAGALDQIRQDLSGSGTTASRPSASKAGNLWLPTDGMYHARDTGSAWSSWGPHYPLTPPPALAGFTWVNQGTATATQAADGSIYLLGPAGNENARCLVKSAAATPYTVVGAFLPLLNALNYSGIGLCMRESSSGKLILHQLLYSTGIVYDVRKMGGPTTFSADATTVAMGTFTSPLWLRVGDDGTNRNFDISPDGRNWSNIFSELRNAVVAGAAMTADQVGFCVFTTGTSGATPQGTLISWTGP